jgi:hypothetical protein
VGLGVGLGLDAVVALVDVGRLLGVGLFDHYGLVILLELYLPLLAWLGLGLGLGLGLVVLLLPVLVGRSKQLVAEAGRWGEVGLQTDGVPFRPNLGGLAGGAPLAATAVGAAWLGLG